MMGANRIMHNTTKNIIVGDVMGKYWDMSGMKYSFSRVFVCKSAKKNPHLATFSLKVVLLQANMPHFESVEAYCDK